ncbi:betaine--homocysteine S-methyltransferase 1-like [Penaeus japonicus]|uniref:betaine--homocysteine S-methyltransferase 1-like n=1 Tax=Penaeus japonicus TaxID=27405 RepID=UPI001C70B0F8|nr:betaine--homocysteine S-methyltransferase 1-like [Penaeus japonicus]
MATGTQERNRVSVPASVPVLQKLAGLCEVTVRATGREMVKKGLLERLQEGVVVGDGGFVIALEKRGYVKGGPWTPEVVVEHPDAVKQLHREFMRAGSDVLQTLTFYSTDDKLKLGGNEAGKNFTCSQINDNACRIAHEVAEEGDVLVAGSVSQCPSYTEGKGKAAVQAHIKTQVDAFVKNKVDFIIAEFFMYVEEIEWVIEEVLKSKLPVAATMCIGPEGDLAGVNPGQCGVRMARAGANVVGVNCMFDPVMIIDTIRLMKEALDAEGLRPFLMTQPNGFFTEGADKAGYLGAPEYPFAMEARTVTRFDVHKYARAAYDLGVRYIGGCCGFEAYHIRAISEELAKERGKLPPASEKHEPWGGTLRMSSFGYIRARANEEYWRNLVPSTGHSLPPTHPVRPAEERKNS